VLLINPVLAWLMSWSSRCFTVAAFVTRLFIMP
jgi:hypothetical protein